MQTQWAWLLQLTMCLETHLKHASDFHQFYEEASETDAWVEKQTDMLNSYYNRSEVSLDEGEKLIREIQVCTLLQKVRVNKNGGVGANFF